MTEMGFRSHPWAWRMALACLLVAAFVVTPRVGAAVPAGDRTFTDPQGHFTLTVPDGWTVADLPDPGSVVVALVAPPSPVPLANVPPGVLDVSVSPVQPTATLDAIADTTAMTVMARLDGARLVPDGVQPTTLGGQPARAFAVQGVQQGAPVTVSATVVWKDGMAYTLAFTSGGGDSLFAAQQTVLDSFTFTG